MRWTFPAGASAANDAATVAKARMTASPAAVPFTTPSRNNLGMQAELKARRSCPLWSARLVGPTPALSRGRQAVGCSALFGPASPCRLRTSSYDWSVC
jgi:hypothetical protein